MAAITGKTESWNGHSFSEVETFIKSGKLVTINNVPGKTYKKLTF